MALTGESSLPAASALRRSGHLICSAWEPSERCSSASTTPSEPATPSRFSSKRLLSFVRCARRPRASAAARARSSFVYSSPPSHLHHTCTLIHSPSITFASPLSHQMQPHLDLNEEQVELFARCVAAAAPKTLSSDQRRGLELVCSGHDGLVLLRTGGGKTHLAAAGAGRRRADARRRAVSRTGARPEKSTDKIFAGTGFMCCHDERSEGERGEAVESTTLPSAAAAPSAAAGLRASGWRGRRGARGRGGARRTAPDAQRSPKGGASTSAASAATALAGRAGARGGAREAEWAAAEATRGNFCAAGLFRTLGPTLHNRSDGEKNCPRKKIPAVVAGWSLAGARRLALGARAPPAARDGARNGRRNDFFLVWIFST